MIDGKRYAVVIGGVNIDIGGRPFQKLIARDSNPGRVRVSLGGVGRNIAHNLSLLGINVFFLTAFGDDVNAQTVESACASAGIDIRYARKIPRAVTSTYLFISDSDGDMALAVADMEICEQISPAYLAANLPLINSAQVVVVDGNLSEEALAFLAGHCTAPIFADPVSVTKAEKLQPVLSAIHTLKPNRLEAEKLSGVRVTDEHTARRAAEKLLEAGTERVFLSLGKEGVLAADSRECFLQPSLPAAVRNTTGAGDAFMAGLVWAYLEGMALGDSAKAASAAAAVAAEGEQTINPALSVSEVRARL